MSAAKVCQCCLSTERRLAPMGKHANLYHALLLTKTNITVKKQSLVCWECLKILNNIEVFRSKITQAQTLLNDKSLVQFNSLSTLSPMTILDDYKLIIHDDIKDMIPLELDIDIIKNEKFEGDEQNALINEQNVQESDSSDINEPIKEEMINGEDGDINDDMEMIQDMEMTDDKNVKIEIDKLLIGIKTIENKSEVVKKKITRNRGVLKKKYRTIIMENFSDKRNLYDKVIIDQQGVKEWMEKLKRSRKTKKIQCDKCYLGFAKQEYYDRHFAVRHAKRLGRFECDTCGFRFAAKQELLRHVTAHSTQFVCRLCAHTSRTRNEMYMHFTHGPHGRQRECKKCGLRFDCTNRREFFDHYRSMHERHVCDQCGRVFLSKFRIIAHIKKQHTIHRCKICNTTYGTMDSYNRHHKEKHVVDDSEQNYCVECNIRFMNGSQYRTHLLRSVKHRPHRAIPCPECGKVYAKNCNMLNHYKLVHLKKSDYYCALCDKYFLKGDRLRYHQKYFHEKQPKPKNKLCKYCGKGFNNNRMLDNHVRTHTGERPFACALCTAAFTQKQSLTAHIRSAHK